VVLPRGFRPPRRWPWIALAIIGLAGILGWWWIPPLFRTVSTYGHLGLSEKDSIASVVSMIVGVLSLVASIILGALQIRQAKQPAAAALQPPPERKAAERLRAHLGRSEDLKLMSDPRIGALSLRVHPAVDLPPAQSKQAADTASRMPGRRLGLWPSSQGTAALDPDLPLFVKRDCYEDVCSWMRRAQENGGFLLLIGNSSVGKTRLLYEAARQMLPDFTVLAPDLGDGALVTTIAAARFPLPKLLVWLDELQRFLPGPYFIPDEQAGHSPITATAVRQLLEADTPVVIVGTLWPEHVRQLRATETDPATDSRLPRHAQAVDILSTGVHEVTLETFSKDERATAAALASRDPRLAQAVNDRDYNVTEALAGARETMRRYQQGTDAHRAVVHAAVDARRLGVQAPLTSDLLKAAARGYLTAVYGDEAWFDHALGELTSYTGPQDRATAPLIAVANSERTAIVGYTVADYLLQQLTRQRRSSRLSSVTWQAFIDHTHDPDDILRLADRAANQLLYRQAEALVRGQGLMSFVVQAHMSVAGQARVTPGHHLRPRA
jgi:hypothetical protein